ncbi:MAG: PQQ-binding-like beta-propeller repeat protein [Phycisphaerae bacterium]
MPGFAADMHVVWATQLSPPVGATPGENHATPVLSPDNTRLYVGGPNSKLSAVDAVDGTLLWTLTLGDGTGTILQTAAVAADGTLYVGVWDNTSPYDGFCKIRDEGDHGTIVWTFPLRRALASPTITPDGLIIVGGEHQTLGWQHYALTDLGDTYEITWSAAADTTSSARIGGTPALSPDGDWLFAATYKNQTFWQLDAATGDVTVQQPLDYYCLAPSPVVNAAGCAFIGEGMSTQTPDDQTQGKLYAFEPDAGGVVQLLGSLPLLAGHLNGGTAALRERLDGTTRLYVPANGYGKTSAKLIAVDFDPEAAHGEPPTSGLTKVWEVPLGTSVRTYPQAVVTADRLVYVLGPVNHQLYGIRDADDEGRTLWTVPLTTITRVTGWQPGTAVGPQGVTVGPDGTLYWHAIDGYLYALRGWISGDLDGDGELTTLDLHFMAIALVDPAQFAVRFPEIDINVVGDLTGDERVNFFDLNRLIEVLAGE